MENTNLISNKFKALLFDFDGTLLDSFSAHFEVYKVMFAHFGIQINKEHFLNTYSPNWYKTYEAMGLPKEDWESADIFWVEEADRHSPNLLPGVHEALTKLYDSYAIGLVTSGSSNRVVKDLNRTGIKKFFKTVVTGDDIQIPKPSPESLELALHNMGMQPGEVVYIGDAYADYEMSKAAGVYFIGVRSSFASINSNDPYYCVYSITELQNLLGV